MAAIGQRVAASRLVPLLKQIIDMGETGKW